MFDKKCFAWNLFKIFSKCYVFAGYSFIDVFIYYLLSYYLYINVSLIHIYYIHYHYIHYKVDLLLVAR